MDLKVSKKDFIWNMLGSTAFSFVSMFLSLVIINLTDTSIGGIFSFGYTALAQTIFTISYFGARSYHISDVQYRFNFHAYKIQRIITSIFAVIIGLLYVFVLYINNVYDIEKTIILCLLVICGMLDGFFDVYECELQRIRKLYLAGIGLFFRTIVFALILVSLVFITKNMILSLLVSVIFKYVVGYLLEINVLNKEVEIDASDIIIDTKLIIELTIVLLPMFLSTFMDIILHSGQKFAIDLYIDDYHSGLYNILFMPSNIIYLMASFIMRPLVTNLSLSYENNKIDYYKKTTKIIRIGSLMTGFIFAISIVIFMRLYVLIIKFITNNAYGVDLTSTNSIIMFVLIMLGSCFYALSTPLFHFIVIEKKLKQLVVCYAIATIISIILNFLLIWKFGFFYSAVSYFLSMLVWFIIIYICFYIGKVKCLNTKS